MNDRRPGERESGLLREIGSLSDRLRELRRTGAAKNAPQIRALEGQSRDKWIELRTLRATPANLEPPTSRGGGLYR